MLLKEMCDYYKHYMERLSQCQSEEEIEQEGFIPAIKDLLSKGVDVNSKDGKGNTLLHHLVSNEVVRSASQKARENGDYNQVLDVPFLIATYQKKLNPFVMDDNGFTPSCLAAYYGNTKDHAMLLSLESAVNHRRNMMGIYAISQMMCSSEFVTDSGHRVWMSNTQNEGFISACNMMKNLKRVADGKVREME